MVEAPVERGVEDGRLPARDKIVSLKDLLRASLRSVSGVSGCVGGT